jgi:hypothetical protein
VFAIWVVFVSADAVVVVGVPVRPGLAKGAAPETSATAKTIAPVRPATEVTASAAGVDQVVS